MPTYEYICDNCKNEFEKVESIKAKPTKTCPKCEKPVRRKISKLGCIIFNGSGFYCTDYSKGKGK